MKLLTKLWSDEGGAILSSELVLVGTVGVIGATVGLNAISTAVNEELEDVAFAIRSLDQSYTIPATSGCGAWTAGSSFQQEPVKESLRELEEQIDRDEASARKRMEEHERREEHHRREMQREPERKPEMKKPEPPKPEMKQPDPKKTPPKKRKKNKSDEEVLL